MASLHEKWFRPKPNNGWQLTENQTFVDVKQFHSVLFDEDDFSDDEEEEDIDSSEEKSDTEESDDEGSSECDEAPSGNPNNGFGGPPAAEQDIDIVARFLEVMEDEDLHRDSIARLRQFFKSAKLGDLEEGTWKLTGSRIFLEDRNFSSKIFRPYSRSMTPKKLHSALKKQRYPQTISSMLERPKTRWTKSKDCQVERRTIFVSNPDEWIALVLAANASQSQAPVLFEFLDQYLKCETSISVVPNPLVAQLTLHLNLPFYTFRKSPSADSRKNHEDKALRKCEQLPCMEIWGMDESLSELRGWICESQISVAVSVVDIHGWTAYAFEDNYYKTLESLPDLDLDYSIPGFYFPDALAAGNFDSTRPLGPMEYFLKVFQYRIHQAHREWLMLVDRLEETVKRRDKQIQLQQRYSEWISAITGVVSDVSRQLSTTLTAWDEFERRCFKYFPEDIKSPLEMNIGHTFSKIKLLKDKLDSLSNEIVRDQSTLGAHLAVENTGTAKLVKALTVISILMMPMILNIALFSIQPGVMPFQMNFLAFVKSYFALALFVCLVWMILSQWDTLVMLAWYTLESLDRAVQASYGADIDPSKGEDDANEASTVDLDVDGQDSRIGEISSATGRAIWRHFNVNLPRRDEPGAPVTEAEPADLANVICV
ncbi:hypothetical protein Daus18300_007201 [Diaporthe australafricana]|uniref:Uncharacterized protein n=1 Tax=Diaporthe australafricana TaxID=127596 RepID=A0ABR3WNR8_9PEZI